MAGNQPISFGNTSSTWNMYMYFLFYRLGSRMDQKDCPNWSRKDRLTALESQIITFKLFHVGAKVVRCHKRSFGGFVGRLFCNINFKHCKSYEVGSFLGRLFLFIKTSKNCYWPLFGHFCCPLLEIQGWPPLKVVKILKYANAMRSWPLLTSGRSSGGSLFRSLTV